MYIQHCAHPQPPFPWSVVPACQLSSVQWYPTKWHWLYFLLPNRPLFLDFPINWKPITPLTPLPRPALCACDVSKVHTDQWVFDGARCASGCLSHTGLLQTSQGNPDNHYLKNNHNPVKIIFGLGRWNWNSAFCFMKEKMFLMWGKPIKNWQAE